MTRKFFVMGDPFEQERFDFRPLSYRVRLK